MSGRSPDPPPAASSARDALAGPEDDAARIRRLARHVLDEATPLDRRRDLLAVLLTADPDRAREVALQVAGGPDKALRETASHVVASTRGSVDDVDRLHELLGRPDLTGYARRNLSAALEGIWTPSAEDTISALASVLGVTATRAELRADVLLPVVDRRLEFLRTAAQVRARARRGEPVNDFVSSAARLCDQMVDFVLLAADGVDAPPGVDSDEVAAIRYALPGRPDVAELLSRRRLRMRFPWFAACIVLRGQVADETAAAKSDEDRARISRSLLASVIESWARDMQDLHWAMRSMESRSSVVPTSELD